MGAVDSAKPNILEKLWGATAALLFAASVGHALRLVDLGWTLHGPGRDLTGRDYVAIAAIIGYGVVSVPVWLERKIWLWVSIIGPFVGLSAVILIPGATPDLFQVVLGIIQFVGMFMAIWLLWSYRHSSQDT